uniref:Uncharacterized protein n=1 Tax=Oryza sativa subsp. japonica TaxID=39947 RepID=H2KWA1_ORYSJ|nr:hypothetical protein LOC_Os11g37944 [Oryza sativa Japonica Group]
MTNEQYKSWRFPEWLAAAVMLGFRVGMQRAEMLTGSAAEKPLFLSMGAVM